MAKQCETALEFHSKGFNCCQSVIVTFAQKYGVDENFALKIGGGFGGGARCGELCGAVSGGIMVVGLVHGQVLPNDKETKTNCNEKTVEFLNEFKKLHKTVICHELLGCNVTTPEGFEFASENNLFCTKCNGFISDAVEILIKLGY